MTHRSRSLVRPYLFAAALACLLGTMPVKPAAAQSYDGLMQSQTGYAPDRGGGSATGGGYDGLVGWEAQRSTTNPYGTAPAGDIYQFVRGAGGTMEERRANEKQAREEQRRARQQQMLDTNRQRAEAINARLQEENEARQLQNAAQRAEIMRRIEQQQRQQQQQQQQQQRR